MDITPPNLHAQPNCAALRLEEQMRPCNAIISKSVHKLLQAPFLAALLAPFQYYTVPEKRNIYH